jgi:hypothetical protein
LECCGYRRPPYEVGERAGQPFCALEFVAGGSLARKLAGRPLVNGKWSMVNG